MFATPADAVRAEIRHLLSHPETFIRSYGLDQQDLRDWYQGQDQKASWSVAGRPSHRADIVFTYLRQAHQHGLATAPFKLHTLGLYWQARAPESVARRDLLLSAAIIRYARWLRSGRRPQKQVDPRWHIAAQPFDAINYLKTLLASGGVAAGLDVLPPPHAAYDALRKELQRYRDLQAKGAWPTLEDTGLLLEGRRSAAVARLRERLAVEGYGVSPRRKGANYFDSVLAASLRHYQSRHGLRQDGTLGPRTRAALNVTVAERIRQIELNVERWRWMPRELGQRHILVNMGGFLLQAVDHGETQLDMKVIIGRKYRSTPAFSGSVTHMVFNPYWNVPARIARIDLLPQQREDQQYFRNKGIRVYNEWGANAPELDSTAIDWQQVQARPFPYKLRQDPGPENSLGRVKFMFHNPFNIYLHDTPTPQLFAHPVRTFSSGCIRVEKPLELAQYVLGDDGLDAVAEELESGETRTLNLPQPVPVYLVYWTAWVAEDGSLHFRRDFYGRDARMAQAWAAGSG